MVVVGFCGLFCLFFVKSVYGLGFLFSVGINIVLCPISSSPTVFFLSLLLEVLYSLKFGQHSDAFLWPHLLVGQDSTCLVIVHDSYSWVHSSFFKC